MSQSLFVTHQQLTNYQFAMDNVLMMKLLYDEGIPFPNQDFMTEYREDSLFLLAVSLIFKSPVCMEKEDQNQEHMVFSVGSFQIQEWMELVRADPENEELQQTTETLLEPITDLYEGYCELCLSAEMTTFGLRIAIMGTWGFNYPFVEGLLEFKRNLTRELSIWKTKGEIIHERNDHYVTREREFDQYPAAV